MKIKIEFEIPMWTRWIAIGLAGGIALGYGMALVHADTVAVSTWNSDDVLTAEALNLNFKKLQDATNAQQVALNALTQTFPDCPVGYSRDPTDTTHIVCKNLVDEIVRVGSGGSAFWIDRYEATIWSNADGSGTQFGLASVNEYPSGFPLNGQYSTALYAVSKRAQQPSAYVTWFQAVAACEASGKQLPTGQEWVRGARGTVDPDTNDGQNGWCNTYGSSAVRKTGAGSHCTSIWGADDMIGNLWEWTADWGASVASDPWGPTAQWSAPVYNGDAVWSVISTATDNGTVNTLGIPVAVMRGGSFMGGSASGIFAINFQFAPSNWNPEVGFRCVILH